MNDLFLIKRIIEDHYNVNLSSKSRKRDIVAARQVAHYLACKLTKCSLAEIGAEIGGKNHATVLYSKRTVTDIMTVDKRLSQDVEFLEEKIKNNLEKSYSKITKIYYRSFSVTYHFNKSFLKHY